MKLRRTIPTALVFSLAMAGGVFAETIEGTVTSVEPDGKVQIVLPDGADISIGDSVQILAEIPGLGPIAIDSEWLVTGTDGGVANAAPKGTPAGTPQVGYLAKIESKETTTDPVSVDPSVGQGAAESHVAVNPAIDLALSEADVIYQRAVKLMASRDQADHRLGVDLLREAAAMMHPRAITDLGTAIMFGRGTDADFGTGMELHEDAASLEDTQAMIRLALAHLMEPAQSYNPAQALYWLQLAAEFDDPHGMFILAMIHEDGLGDLPASLPKMVQWLEQAARNGHTDAMFILGLLYLDGEDGVIAKDTLKAEQYWTQAAQAGHVSSMEALAEFYEGENMDGAAHWAQAAQAAPTTAPWREDPRCLSSWECYIPAVLNLDTAVAHPSPE